MSKESDGQIAQRDEHPRTRDHPEDLAVAAADRAFYAALERAERPILKDLAAQGLDVASVEDIDPRALPTAALPVLMEHLERGGYPDRIMEGLGRALATKQAAEFWPRLRACYLMARGEFEEDGIAIALAASARRDQLEQLIELVNDESRGESRVLLLEQIRRSGGERGWAVIKALKKHPVVGKEATAMLRGRAVKEYPELDR